MCALLYIEHGALSFLELVTSSGPWPEEPLVEKITYFEEVLMGNGFSLVPSERRHTEAVARALRGRRERTANGEARLFFSPTSVPPLPAAHVER